MTGAVATVTVRLGDRTLEQLHAQLDGWDIDVEVRSRAPTIGEVLTYVAGRHDVSVAQLTGDCRTRHLVDLRAAVSWFAYRCLGRGYSAIGRVMGDRDHSTILSQVGRATSGRAAEPEFAAIVTDILDHFGFEDAA